MAIQKIKIEEFLELARRHPVCDVRSPAEFSHAHIPGAYSLPLFTDDERRIVGTAYKQINRETAIKRGLEFFGPKMVTIVETVEKWVAQTQNMDSPDQPNRKVLHKTVLVYCWRGGMRSEGVAWLLDLYGFRVFTLIGGYKSYRRWTLRIWELPGNLQVLGGYTGSGKTRILKELQNQHQPVIDLEGLARHRGSAFGALGQPRQPSQEQFENLLALRLWESVRCRHSAEEPGSGFPANHEPIWIEDESQRIGLVNIPNPLWNRMRSQPLLFLEIPFDERLSFLVKEYGHLAKVDLAEGITRIQKRLGGLETKTALQRLLENDIRGCFAILLKYYDKKYLKGLEKRNPDNVPVTRVTYPEVDPVRIAEGILNQKLVRHAK